VKNFEVVVLDGQYVAKTDPLRRRIALRIDDEDKDVVSLKLDSEVSRKRQAKAWSKRFKLKEADVFDKLRRAALDVTAEDQKKQAERFKPKAKGKEPPPPTPITLAEAREIFNRWLQGLDPDLLDVVFGVIFAHLLDGDPVWLFIIGPPGDGKTEVVRALSIVAMVFMLSSLKPAALISGYETDDGSDPSLLPKLDGKVLIVKDFTTVLTMPNEARAEILGTLRDAYDGEASKAFGNGKVPTYRSRFGLLAAVTPAIESYWGVSQQLGERFLRFRLQGGGRVAKVTKAVANAKEETRMRCELSEAARGVLAQPFREVCIPLDVAEQLIHLADFVSRARSEVARDRKGAVEFIPMPEIGTRIGKALKKLAMGIALARGADTVDADILRIIRRVAKDCIPSVRSKLLAALWELRNGEYSTADVAEAAEVATDTARVWLDDLRLLGIVQRSAPAKNLHQWRLRDEFMDTMTRAGLGDEVSTPPPDFVPHAESDSDPDGVERGGKSHPQPYMHDNGGDDSDQREREAIQAVELEAEQGGTGQ